MTTWITFIILYSISCNMKNPIDVNWSQPISTPLFPLSSTIPNLFILLSHSPLLSNSLNPHSHFSLPLSKHRLLHTHTLSLSPNDTLPTHLPFSLAKHSPKSLWQLILTPPHSSLTFTLSQCTCASLSLSRITHLFFLTLAQLTPSLYPNI